jgi:multidrug resistance efflux pump
LANAKARINRDKISLSRSNINFNEAARILAETSVIAEFDGVLSEVTGDLGALVNSGERMALLIDPNALEVSFRVSNSEFNHMTRDGLKLSAAKVFVSIDGSDKAIPASVDRVSAAVGEGQTGRELYASLDPVEIATVRPGDFVTVRLEEPALDNVAVLPATAASATGDVLVLGKSDRLEVLNVEILRKRGNEIIVAIGNLAGREIILERAPQLGAGIKVEPRRSNKGLSKEQTTSE